MDDESNVTGTASKPEDGGNDGHDTLKYHLLGPSLLKAGQDSVDQKKVSEVIYNASKGSKFFNNEQVKDRTLTEKINRILARKKDLERLDLGSDLRRADDYIAELELQRDLTQTIIHLDCDAFYAAVEELDRPALKNVPFAVGKGVLTTCNYEARKFGCRSGMASFVAKKLCPQLVCLPMNFDKYTAKAEEIRAVIAQYDPRFESASIDEAYLNITEYCKEHELSPWDAVSQLRQEIHEATKITVSAGIAANAKLAKIASNQNKPNGQFQIAPERATIIAFMRDLPTRKVNGIGRVLERELDAIGVKTCGDIYAQRSFLKKLFGEKAFLFLIQCHLGLGRTNIQPAEEYERKSVGTESTFGDLSGKEPLRTKLRHIAEELEKDLERSQVKGRTLVLKIKMHTYEVYTRQAVTPYAVHRADDLYKFGLPMLVKLEKEMGGLRLRLMGLRCTNLVSTKKEGIDFFGMHARQPKSSSSNSKSKVDGDGDGEWEVWPEEEFEHAARQELQDEMNEIEALSQTPDATTASKDGTSPPTPPPNPSSIPTPAEDSWACPICSRPQPAEDRAFNEHIDFCLSKQTIRDAVKDTSKDVAPPASRKEPTKKSASTRGRKRKTTGNGDRPLKRSPFTM